MRFLDGIPLALKSFGSHEERRSVMAAFKKRFLATFLEKEKERAWLSLEASAGADWYLVGAILSLLEDGLLKSGSARREMGRAKL